MHPSISIVSGLKARSLKEEKARDHSGHFFEYVFNLKLAKFQWEIHELMMDGFRHPRGVNNPLLILAPRDHAKTTNCAEAFPLWRIGQDSLVMIQIISSTATLAEKRIAKIASCIRFNKRYKELFGELYPASSDFTWTKNEIEVKRDQSQAWNEGRAERDPTVSAFGISTSVEGGRADLQIYDDVVSMENARSEITRANVHQKFWMSFDPMLLPDGQQIFVGTRYHYADLYSELIPKFDKEKRYYSLWSVEVEQDRVNVLVDN